MKRRWYRILSVLLTVTMVAGLFPAEVSAQEPETEIVEEVSENDAEDPYADTVSENEDTVSENDAEENDADTVSDNDAGEPDELVSGSDDETPDEQETEDAEAPDESDDEEVIDYGTDEEDEEPVFDAEPEGEVVEVSSWEELSAAFDQSEEGKIMTIKLMADLNLDGKDLARGATCFRSFDVRGQVTLDFNGHILSGNLYAPNDDQMKTYAFLRFYVGTDISATLIFDDTAGGGGVTYEASTYIDYPCMAVDTKPKSGSLTDHGVFSNKSKVIVNGGNFFLTSSIRKFGRGSVGGYPCEDEYNAHNNPYSAIFMRSAFASRCNYTEINGGVFTAVGIGTFGGENVAAREMSALGLLSQYVRGLRINGGTFRSSGYAIKSAHISSCPITPVYTGDDPEEKEKCRWQLYTEHASYKSMDKDLPKIRGGVFKGGICLTGKDFYYMDDNKDEIRDFSVNRGNTAAKLFDTYSGLIIDEKEKKAGDLTWRDLETKDLIEVYTGYNIATIENVFINGVKQESYNNSLQYLTGTKLDIKCSTNRLHQWYIEAFPGQITLKNEYQIIKDGESDPVWSSEGLGYNYAASYTADTPGDYKLILKHKVLVGERVIAEDTVEKQLTIGDKIAIKHIDVDLTVPVAGDTPKNAVPVTEHITSTKTSWNHVVGGKEVIMSATEQFVAGEKYTVEVWLKAEEGYTIPDDTVVLINGNVTAEFSSRFSEVKGIWVASYEVPENSRIDSVNVSLTEPVAGAKPAEAVSTTDHVTVTATYWKVNNTDEILSDDEVFEAGRTYKVSVLLEAEAGYKFSDEVILNFNTKKGTMHSWSGHSVNFYTTYTIPEEKTTSIDTIHAVVIVPEAGACPQAPACKTPYITFLAYSWICMDDELKLMNATDKFEAGKTYKLLIRVEAASGYSLADNVTFMINNSITGDKDFLDKKQGQWSADFTVEGAALESISITTAPTKTTYIEDDFFDPAGMVVTANYTDNTTAEVTAYTYTPDGPLKTTDKEITISYTAGGITKTATQTISVNKKTITIDTIEAEITVPVAGANPRDAVSKTPNVSVTSTVWKCNGIELKKTDTFEIGKTYSAWITVEADLGYSLPNNATLTLNNNIATMMSFWQADGTRAGFIADFTVGKTLDSISVTTPPTKTTYIEGETFDPAGMVVTAKYDDNTTQEVIAYTYTPNGALSLSDKEITVSYTAGGITKTAKQAITVKESGVKMLSSIAVTTAPAKTAYSAGESFDPAGMVVTATYNDKSTAEVNMYTYQPIGALKASDTEITISYTEGSITKTTSQPITVIDVNESLYVTFTEGDSFVYTGTKITPAVAVMYRGKALVEGVDYTVKYKNNVKTSVGATKLPTVIVTGKTVAASGSRTFTITRKDIDDPDVTAAGITVAKGKTASPVLFYAGRKLGKNDINNPDAKVKFETDGSITIEGKGNYTGKRTIDVKVVDEKKIQVTAFNPVERIYNGLEQPLAASELTVVSGGTTLELGKDFEINYPADIASAGTVKITIVGIGEYSGSVSKSYKISPCTTGINVDVAASVQYKAGGATPEVTVTDGTSKLIAGRDYTLKYSNNKAANGKKPASVKVTFKGSYKGAAAVTKDFSITALDISTAMPKINGDEKAYIKSGKYLKAPYVEVNGTMLTAKDMDVAYKIDGKDAKAGDKITDDMMSAGKITVEVTVSGKGNYTGTITGSYTISKAEKNQDISKAGVKLDKKSYAFTGENLKPVVTVQIGKGANAVTLKEGVDYKVEYFANVNKGKATIVITGLGDNGTGTTKYYGSKKISFKIGKGEFNWL